MATFEADAAGVVDPDRLAPLSGAYSGVWGMGLLSSMQPIGTDPAGAYFWSDMRATRFTLAVRAHGRTIGSTSFARRFSAVALPNKAESLSSAGFVGDFIYPTGAVRRPAILLLGGSEGGPPGPLQAGILPAQGYPVLSLAYFKEPGLPQQLLRVPSEYFQRALIWLGRQPQVDSHHVAVLGVSRGSEAALLSGAYFPRLVHAVIAMVPSDVAICSYPGCAGPAWTFRGRSVPFTREYDDPEPTDDPAAVIPVWQIKGPVFLACATADQTWTSCPYAQAIIHHLDTHHDPYPHVLYSYTNAGHPIGSLMPYEPIASVLQNDADPEADQQARAQDWPRLLSFLTKFARSN